MMFMMAQAATTTSSVDPQVFAALLGALAGAVITFILTEASAWIRGRREEVRLAKSARAALRYEVSDNLSQLGDFWSRVANRSTGTIDARKTGYALLSTSAPNWNDAIWRGLATTFVMAFSDVEISAIYRLYSTLADIEKTQHRLTEVEAADTARQAAAFPINTGLAAMPTVQGHFARYFESTAAELIPPLDERIVRVLAHGNPIPQ